MHTVEGHARWRDTQQGARLGYHMDLVQKLSPLWLQCHQHDQDALRAFCILLAHHKSKSDAAPLDLQLKPPWAAVTAKKDKVYMLKDHQLSLNRMLPRVTLFSLTDAEVGSPTTPVAPPPPPVATHRRYPPSLPTVATHRRYPRRYTGCAE